MFVDCWDKKERFVVKKLSTKIEAKVQNFVAKRNNYKNQIKFK